MVGLAVVRKGSPALPLYFRKGNAGSIGMLLIYSPVFNLHSSTFTLHLFHFLTSYGAKYTLQKNQ